MDDVGIEPPRLIAERMEWIRWLAKRSAREPTSLQVRLFLARAVATPALILSARAHSKDIATCQWSNCVKRLDEAGSSAEFASSQSSYVLSGSLMHDCLSRRSATATSSAADGFPLIDTKGCRAEGAAERPEFGQGNRRRMQARVGEMLSHGPLDGSQELLP